MGAPDGDVFFPKDGAIEGVARDEFELGGHEDGDAAALVHDVKDAAALGDLGGDGGHAVVVAGPAGIADPLHAFWRADEHVLGGEVALAVVGVVGPVIHLGRAGFDDFFPVAIGFLEQGDAVGDEDAVDFGARDLCVFDDEQVDEIFDVGQVVGREEIGGDRPVSRPDAAAEGSEGGGVAGEGLDLVGIVGAEGGGEFWVGSAEVDNETTFDLRLVEKVGGGVRKEGGRGGQKEGE